MCDRFDADVCQSIHNVASVCATTSSRADEREEHTQTVRADGRHTRAAPWAAAWIQPSGVGQRSTVAKARTGNVPMPRTFTGTAKNRAPATGTASSPVRCSTIGMPAARSTE